MHNEELHNVNSFPKFISVIKSMRMKWVGHVERTGEMSKFCRKIRMDKTTWKNLA
jgi:hypothetical protein